MNQSWIYLRRKSCDSTETVTNYSFSDIYLRILKHILFPCSHTKIRIVLNLQNKLTPHRELKNVFKCRITKF